jgi:hypothetical protein
MQTPAYSLKIAGFSSSQWPWGEKLPTILTGNKSK